MIEEHNHKHCWCKYVGLVVATLVGAFLAFYFVADMTIKHLTDPVYQMKRIDRMMEKENRKAMKMNKEMMREAGFPMHGAFINIEKGAKDYKIFVDLKPFENNPDDIDVSIEGNNVTIAGEIESEKRNEERIMNFSQTFYLEDKVDFSKIKKTTERGKCIITLPIKK